MNELFLKIVNMSLSASWLVAAVLILKCLLQKSPKWIHVLLWGIVAVRLICPFSIESIFSLIPSAEVISPTVLQEKPEINTGIPVINNTINPIIQESEILVTPEKSINIMSLLVQIASIIWVVGIILLFIYTIISYWSLHRKVATAVLYKDNIFQSENVSSPFVFGIIKPKIYLPFRLDKQDMEHVLAHEQAHIHRKDHWWKPLGFLLLTLHWFNPLMWLSYVLLCRDIELACDEKVIQKLNAQQRADYTQALVTCSINRRSITACPLAFGEVGIKERVQSVMNYKKVSFWIILLSLTICVVIAICFLTNPKSDAAASNTEQENEDQTATGSDKLDNGNTETDSDKLNNGNSEAGSDKNNNGKPAFTSDELLLLSVLTNKTTFISEKGTSVYLKDFKWGDFEEFHITPKEYVFVDLDQDGINELVTYVLPIDNYMIFRHCNKDVYGYAINARSLIDLKEDGSFMQSAGAGINWFSRIIFNKKGYEWIKEAYKDDMEQIYQIDGKNVSLKEIENYVEKWETNSDVQWIEISETPQTIDLSLLKDAPIPNFEDKRLEYEYTCIDLDGDGLVELLVQMADAPEIYNGVFHIENGKLFCWNSDEIEMASREYPLKNGTMVSQYDYNGSRSYTLFRYLSNGNKETIAYLFTREISVYEHEPCPYYELNGTEIDEDTFEEQLEKLIISQMLEGSMWKKF